MSKVTVYRLYLALPLCLPAALCCVVLCLLCGLAYKVLYEVCNADPAFHDRFVRTTMSRPFYLNVPRSFYSAGW
jgi:hypothetical protein